ncbi:expressed unknown protein [Seminavis robusta]|uniref:Uncharacterized protein n=1 Tax=Seminavis robusta TaxID=568900 RepID=A0A9N8DC13_9STRA|nr:expressed unknown protein [Seminavis robusta]|eukprot:Sro29_g019140.1 n/a (763) ;mRNA; f:73992-76280
MGACQSSLCQFNEDEVQESILRAASRKNESLEFDGSNRKHLIFDLLSPSYTEATTPASTLISPSTNGPLSLSVISSCTSQTLVGSARSFGNDESSNRQPSKFTFDTPHLNKTNDRSIQSKTNLEEDDDEDPVSDEEQKALASPRSHFFGNPPLLAPPPGQADLLWHSAKARNSVNDHMVRDFNRIRRKASIAERQEKQRKKDAKIEDRLEDIKSYRNLWTQFKEMEQLRSEHVDEQGTDKSPHGTNVALNQGNQVATSCEKTARSPDEPMTNNQSAAGRFSNKSKKNRTPRTNGNDTGEKTKFCLLSDVGMEAQKVLQQERHAARKLARDQEKKKSTASLKETKPSISYFQPVVENNLYNCNGNTSTPQLSPPKLQILTQETKPGRDYGPKVRKDVDALLTDMTDMEVTVRVESGEKRKDDASFVSHDDFDCEFSVAGSHRSLLSQQRDDISMLSSCSSLGGRELPSRWRAKATSREDVNLGSQSGLEVSSRRKHQKSQSHGVAQLVEETNEKPVTAVDNENEPSRVSVKTRIAKLEKATIQPNAEPEEPKKNQFTAKPCVVDDASIDDSVSIEASSPSFKTHSSQLVDHCNHYSAFDSNDLEPTNLEEMFEISSSDASAGKARESIAEKIVLRNASHCQRQQKAMRKLGSTSQVALMSTDEFLRMSTKMSSHAWINVQKVPQKDDSYLVEESSPDETSIVDLENSSTPNMSAIENELGEVLSKFRLDEKIVDSHQMFLRDGGFDSSETSCDDDAVGNLYCA